MKDVETEPTVPSYQGEDLPGWPASRSAGDRLDNRGRGGWSRQQGALLMYPRASLLFLSEVLRQLKAHEKAKTLMLPSEYGRRGAFNPLVFSTSGMCGKETTLFLKALTSPLVDKESELTYSGVMGEFGSLLSFTMLFWQLSTTCSDECRGSHGCRRDHGLYFFVCLRAESLTMASWLMTNTISAYIYSSCLSSQHASMQHGVGFPQVR